MLIRTRARPRSALRALHRAHCLDRPQTRLLEQRRSGHFQDHAVSDLMLDSELCSAGGLSASISLAAPSRAIRGTLLASDCASLVVEVCMEL